MPLTRAADGSLGVRSAGGGSLSQVNNFSISVQVESREGETSNEQADRLAKKLKTELTAMQNDNLVRQTRPGGLLYQMFASGMR